MSFVDIKIIAFYLPQYHRIPENDEWWGEGYTEWTAVKNAKPLFEGHYQPHVPLNGYYYDLLDKDTLIWQANLMNKYGIDGMCFYHYYFEKGKRLLEKPAEKLLEWKDINMPFCFCWANEGWARSWSSEKGNNSWADSYESKSSDTGKGILVRQKYGLEEDWKKHFEYLKRFFDDDRYIKIDNKPVFLIYKPEDIMCLYPMVDFFNSLAIDSDFSGITFIYMTDKGCYYDSSKLCLQRCPGGYEVLVGRDESGLKHYSYEKTWDNIIAETRENCLYTGFVSYDDTPRRNKKGGVYDDVSPEKFQSYLTRIIEKSYSENKGFVFVNAWNEWGEGMHLEPDEKYQFEFLESVRKAKESYKRIDIVKPLEYDYKVNSEYRLNQNIRVLDKWLILKEKGVRIESFLIDNDIRTIIIYGYGILGRHLYDELKDSSIDILSVIDKNIGDNKVDVKRPDDITIYSDAIIVTAINDFEEIYYELKKKGNTRIINLAQIVMELQYE